MMALYRWSIDIAVKPERRSTDTIKYSPFEGGSVTTSFCYIRPLTQLSQCTAWNPKTLMNDRPLGLKIAVVDDDQRILESLTSLLESADHAVRPFFSATGLLDSGCLLEIDCLISDIGMPGMDGFGLLRAVQAARPELPVILITGQADLLDRISPVELGQYRLFTKPFHSEELLTAISDIGSG